MILKKIPSLYKILLESKQQDLLKSFLKKPETISIWSKLNGIKFNTRSGEYTFDSSDPNNIMTIRAYLMSNFNDMMHQENGKYQLAIGRLFTELLENGDPSKEAEFPINLRNILKAVKGTSDDNYDLSGKEMDQLNSEYNQKIKEYNDSIISSMKDYKVENHGNYTVKRINNFEEAREYYKYVSDLNTPWCVTESKDNWNGYSNGDVNAIYFLLRKGFEKLRIPKKMPLNAPYDDYGLSMMFVSISPDGMIQNITSRWNHDCKNLGSGEFEGYGISDTHYFEINGEYDLKRLSDIIGYNILEVCKPNSFEDILKKFKYVEELNSEYIYAKTNYIGYMIFSKETNEPVSKKIYTGIDNFYEGLARIRLNNKWGYIDETGNEVIPCKYESIDYFQEGLARVELKCQLDWKWGYIDKTGKEVVPIKYDYVGNFHEGLARIELNDKCGFVDNTGKVLVPCKYDDAGIFQDGFAIVKLNDKWGYIDKTGAEVIPCKYYCAGNFQDGFAKVMLGKKEFKIDTNGNPVDDVITESKSYNKHIPSFYEFYTKINEELINEENELDSIKNSAIENNTFMKSPNGNPTNLNEKQWLQVRTSSFKKWFGDWENDPNNASKVIDDNGEPLVVYHATKAKFNTFSHEFDGTGSGNTTNTNGCFYFIDSKEAAVDVFKTKTTEEKNSYNIIEVFLNIRNPRTMVLPEFTKTWNFKDKFEQIKTGDGIIAKPSPGESAKEIYDSWVKRYEERKKAGKLERWDRKPESPVEFMDEATCATYVAYNSNQIKSATDNNGFFSPESDNIYECITK